MDFSGKVAIITGGAEGIGKAIGSNFLELGMKISICDINEHAGKLFIEEIATSLKPNVIFQKCDVSSYAEFKAAFEKTKSTFGRIDIVINNAGILNEKQWKKMIEVNFIGVINGIHLAFEFMGTNNGGSGGCIINTASIAGLNGADLCPIYSGCKHAVVGITKSYGEQYHYDKTKVTVNAVCPRAVETQLFRKSPSRSVDEKYAEELLRKMQPLSPDVVAQAVIKLLRDERNGSLLEVNNDGICYVKRP